MHIAAATEAWAGESVAPTADFALPMGAAFDTVVRLIGLGELPRIRVAGPQIGHDPVARLQVHAADRGRFPGHPAEQLHR